jgi:predicted esterase
MLVGFHGYGELAEAEIDRLRSVPGTERWLVVSIQGLHQFYQRRTNEVIAGWMTWQNRELSIADNVAYVSAAVNDVAREWTTAPPVVFTGFSQGVAMAFRAAAASIREVAGVIAAGGDVPPEIDASALRRIRSALVCRGARDEWYSAEKFVNDLRRLRDAGVDARPLEFDGGHEWGDAVRRAAAQMLNEWRS